ncbi:MAG TPA: hypothetical protein ENG33_01460 [Chloroflexi bacterium]|nr:hypothetical protein [Chloroflexota bacterium]
MDIDQLIITLVETGRQASEDELQKIIEYVARAPFASYPVKISKWLREELRKHRFEITQSRMPSIELHLLKRIYVDKQWPPHTTAESFLADLHKAIQHPDVRIWTYKFRGEPYIGFLSPSHIQGVPNPEKFIYVAYSPRYGVIVTGYQASGPEAIFISGFENLKRQR